MMSFAEAQHIEMEKPSTRPGRHRWLPYLTLVLLVESLVFLRLLPRDPLLLARAGVWGYQRHQKQHRQHLLALTKHDPPIGALAPPIRPALGHLGAESGSKTTAVSPLSGQPAVLVFVGPCTSCIENDLIQWQQVQRKWRGLRVLIVSRDNEERIRAFLASSTPVKLPIVADPTGHIAKAYNAAWTSRAYGVNKKGRLVWIEQPGQLAPESIAQIVWARVGGGAK